MLAQMLAEMKKNYQNLADSQLVVTQWGDQAIRLVMDWLRRRKDDNRTLDQFMKHEVLDAEHRILHRPPEGLHALAQSSLLEGYT